jgi:hypothetical protein
MPKDKNCLDIIREYLKENGYDGLAGNECGCGLDDGLMPCGEGCNLADCYPAYKHKCIGEKCKYFGGSYEDEGSEELCENEFEGSDWFTTNKEPCWKLKEEK